MLDCLYDPEEPKYFKMRFEDCTEASWEIYNELDERDTELDVIGIHLADNVSQESTVIHTHAVEFVIRHNKSVHIEKDW